MAILPEPRKTRTMSLSHSTNLIDFLSTELKDRTARNPRYSLRAFAQTLKLSPGELSEILRGKRKPTLKGALKIARALNLSSPETEKLLALTGNAITEGTAHDAATATASNDESRTALQSRQLTADLFHVISDWYCFGILNLADTATFDPEPRRIARRLAITEMEARIALERLERIGLLERIPDKAIKGRTRLRATPDYVLSPQGVPSEAIRSYHRQILEKAQRALDEQSIDERDIAGITFALDPSDLPKLKKQLHRFLDNAAATAAKQSPASKTEVYHLEAALFRLSQPDSRSTEDKS
jgi:uncharacterized protein (TIGR02147 family)